MKIKTIGPLILVLFLAAAAYSQDNSCAYTFTYPKAQVSFSFCVTVWGTLASIQSPIGVNHLDPNNPVEGWEGLIEDNSGGSDGFSVIPGLGIFPGPVLPVVRQPYGPGTLPLIFDYGGDGFFAERIDGPDTINQRDITITLTIHSCFRDCFWSGTMTKVANIRPDGNSTANFAHSSFAAFGYVEHGVMLSVAENVGACTGTDPKGASGAQDQNCYSLTDIPFFTGPGAVLGSWRFFSQNGSRMSMSATYRVF